MAAIARFRRCIEYDKANRTDILRYRQHRIARREKIIAPQHFNRIFFGLNVSLIYTEYSHQYSYKLGRINGGELIPIGWQWVRKILVRYMLLEIHPVYKKPDLILLGRRLR